MNAVAKTKETHPIFLTHEGRDFYYTGKEGNRNSDGCLGWEYACHYKHETFGDCESRVWLFEDGTRVND